MILHHLNYVLNRYDMDLFSMTDPPYNMEHYQKQEIIDFVSSPEWEKELININYSISNKEGWLLFPDRLKSCAITIVNPLMYDKRFDDDSDTVSMSKISLLGFHQMMAILHFHPFTDGNKRTAVNAGIRLIEHITNDDTISYLDDSDQNLLARSVIWYFEQGKSTKAETELRYAWDTIVNYSLL